MKIYYSFYYQDYVFVIGGKPYLMDAMVSTAGVILIEVDPNHLKNSRMHKREEDKEVIFICTVKDN